MNSKQIVIICICVLFFSSVALADKRKDYLYQVSTVKALLEGFYESDITIGDLKKQGDFGIGMLNKIDGAFIAVDGDFYKLNTRDKLPLVKEDDKTPFAMMTFFDPDKALYLKKTMTYARLKEAINKELPSDEIFYAIRITGKFSSVKVDSVPPLLEEELKKQETQQFNDVEGTIVGFKGTKHYGGVSVDGYELLFINKDKTAGGYLVDCEILKGEAQIDFVYDLYLKLPEKDVFEAYDDEALVDK